MGSTGRGTGRAASQPVTSSGNLLPGCNSPSPRCPQSSLIDDAGGKYMVQLLG